MLLCSASISSWNNFLFGIEKVDSVEGFKMNRIIFLVGLDTLSGVLPINHKNQNHLPMPYVCLYVIVICFRYV